MKLSEFQYDSFNRIYLPDRSSNLPSEGKKEESPQEKIGKKQPTSHDPLDTNNETSLLFDERIYLIDAIKELLPSGGKALELGASSVGINQILSGYYGQIDAVEIDLDRAKNLSLQTEKMGNIRVFVGDIFDLEYPHEDYHLVILLGVLNHLLSDGDENIKVSLSSFFNNIYLSLKNEGIMLIALDNPYGMKFPINGLQDHRQKIFLDCKGSSEEAPLIFSRDGLEAVLKLAGFKNTQYYHLFPNWKAPKLIIREDDEFYGLKPTGLLRGNFENYPMDKRPYDYPDALRMESAIKTRLLFQLSNSFLILCSKNEQKNLRTRYMIRKYWDYAKNNPALHHVIDVVKKPDAEAQVERKFLYHSKTEMTLKKLNIKMISSKWIKGESLLNEAYLSILRNDSLQSFRNLLRELLNNLIINYGTGKKDREGYPEVDGEAFDYTFWNIKRDEHGLWHFIDPKWTYLEPLPADYILYRSIIGIYNEIKPLIAYKDHQTYLLDTLKDIFPEFNMDRLMNHFQREQEKEEELKNSVSHWSEEETSHLKSEPARSQIEVISNSERAKSGQVNYQRNTNSFLAPESYQKQAFFERGKKTNPKMMFHLQEEKKPHKIRLITFYLPQYHPIPENDQWWGKGFTEWTNVTKARPLFEGHYQPHLPADLGFYDLRLPEARKAQAELAREYGIYGFCYYHYWFLGKRLLERPLEEVLRTGEPDFPFCLCWANENWTRAWDGQEREVLLKQEYSEEDDLRHIRWLAEVFRDERYIRVDGKPLFLVYRASLLPDPKRTTEVWRDEARRLGLGELYLCKVECTMEEHGDPALWGFDACVEFQPDWTRLGERILEHPSHFRHMVYRYGDIVERMLRKPPVPYKRFPCVTPSWDNAARRRSGAVIFIDSTPERYERWLKEVLLTWNPPSPEENLVFINAWNEWAEGNHLEPDQRFGRGYLEATRRALWAADPIPDWISADALYRDCTSLVERGRLKEAIAGLEKLLNLWPLHASAHNDLGVLYFREREFQKARHHLEMAVKLAPDDVDFRRNLADLLFETGHPEEAIRLCGEILRERPGGIEVPLERAQGLEGRPEEAGGEAPFVSVVLPVCNALGIVEKCLKSLIRSLREVRYEILVIDDASTDGTAEFLGELKSPLLKTTFNKDRLGYVEACRFGAKMASGKFLLFLSQHTEVSPEWLAGLLRQAQSFEDLGAVSSKRTSPPESSLHLGGPGSRVPSGSLLLVRRDLWEATGGFQQHYCFGHFEDAAFLSEIVKKGFRVSSHTFLDSPSDPGEVEPPKGGSHQVDPFPSEKVFPHPRDRLVSIVLLVCNQIEYTQRCLESLFLHTDIPFELIVVDNGSTDGTLEYLRQVREGRQKVGGWRLEVSEAGEVMRVTDARKKREKKVSGKRPFFCRRFKILRNEKNLGFARGNNQGMAEARGHYILLMNNDVVVTPGWLRAMAEIAEKRPEIGLVGPMTNSVSGPQLVEKIGYDPVSLSGLEGFALEFSERNRGRSRPFWRVVGFCMLIKREVIEEIGGLDERFGLGNFEDDDFCLRAKLAGFESWIAEGCFVHHFGHKTFEGAGIDYRESLLKNWEVFKKKWGIPKEVPYGVPLDLTPILHQGYSRTKHFYPLFPEDFSLSLGEALFKTGDLEGARLVFQRLLNRNPMEIDGWNNLGVIAFQEGEIEKAISLFRKALILSPEHPEVLENLGLCLLAKEDYEEAKSLFEKALALRPDSLSLLNRFGQCLIQRGDFRKAEEVYSRSYELDPSQKEVGEILSELQRLNGAEKERRASL